jgi:hypothetical protein
MKNTGPKILGITDEITTCECCGKSGLKRTVALEFSEADVRYLGTTCAAKQLPGLTGADVARAASNKCCCGCGEWWSVGTASGKRYASECFRAARAARAATR